MKRLALLLFVFLLTGLTCRAQVRPDAIEKVDSLMQVRKKPILVLLTAPWCKYCLLQKSQLRNNKKFATRSESFYYAELDAESSRQPVRFNSKIYTYKTSGLANGVNELAEALNGSQALSYPTWIILNNRYEVLGRYNGVLDESQLNLLFDLLQNKKK